MTQTTTSTATITRHDNEDELGATVTSQNSQVDMVFSFAHATFDIVRWTDALLPAQEIHLDQTEAAQLLNVLQEHFSVTQNIH